MRAVQPNVNVDIGPSLLKRNLGEICGRQTAHCVFSQSAEPDLLVLAWTGPPALPTVWLQHLTANTHLDILFVVSAVAHNKTIRMSIDVPLPCNSGQTAIKS